MMRIFRNRYRVNFLRHIADLGAPLSPTYADSVWGLVHTSEFRTWSGAVSFMHSKQRELAPIHTVIYKIRKNGNLVEVYKGKFDG